MMTLWTALPNGVRRSRADDPWVAHISVFMTPRLAAATDDATLSDFPAFLDWPQTLREATSGGLTFDIQVSDGTTLRPPNVVRAAQPLLPDSEAWRAIFPAQTPVRPIDGPRMQAAGDVSITSYDGKGLSRLVRQAYQHTLLQSLAPSQRDTDSEVLLGNDRGSNDALAAFRSNDSKILGAVGDSVIDGDNAVDTIAQFTDFYRAAPRQAAKRQRGADNRRLDFHQIITAISTHPQLLRQLGLVVDLEIPLAQLPNLETNTPTTVRVIPRGLPERIAIQSFRTAVEYASAGTERYRVFCAAKEDQRETFGFYALGRERFGISQEQFEATGIALQQHADGDGTGVEMPRMQQGGIRVLDPSIPGKLRAAVADTAALELAVTESAAARMPQADDDARILYEEQLTRGYRIDVRDTSTDIWRSLCARSNVYRAGDWQWPSTGQRIDDEGIVEFMMYRDEYGEDPRRRALPDLFEWDGWSLAVPRLDSDAEQPADAPITVDSNVRAGSLQTQRFGNRYAFRARRVDIAGNSLSLNEANDLLDALPERPLTSEDQRCVRVESILPPVVFPAQTPDEEEAGDILIIRDAESARYRKTLVRAHVFPPATTIEMAERHGMLDGLDADDAWQLLQRHRGRLEVDDDGIERRMLPPDASAVPYLPDPLAERAVIRLGDSDVALESPRFDRHSQPKGALAHAFLLTVRAGKNETHHDIDQNQITLVIPKGRSMAVSLTCKPSDATLATMALVDREWLGVTANWDQIHNALTARLDSGEASLIAPSRTVQIVHASQRPLIRPVFESPEIDTRANDDTHAVLYDAAFLFDTPSTGRLDVYASWEDIDDSNASQRWQRLAHDAHVGGADISDTDTTPFAPRRLATDQRPALRQEFADTKHHEVTYKAVAITRFIDLYPDALTRDPGNMARSSDTVTLHVPASAAPPVPDVAYVVPTFEHTSQYAAPREWQAEQLGDGLRIYLNRGWFASGVGEQLAIVLAEQPSDAGERDDVSIWGVDTLHDTASLPGPLIADYVTTGTAVRFTDEQGATTIRQVHDVQFSSEHQRAFVDVHFTPQVTFMPLVRLVVARFQQHAIAGCQHSGTRTTDFIPLAPGRNVSVSKASANRWEVRMRGASYAASEQMGANSASSIVELGIEALSIDTPMDGAAWIPTGATATLGATAIQHYDFEWHGAITVENSAWLTRTWRLRLVLREYAPLAHAGLADAPLADYSRLLSAHTIDLSR